MSTIVKKLMLSKRWNEPKVEHMVEIEIDEERLAYLLGGKAVCNRSKKSKIQGGIVTCAVRPTQAAKEKAANANG